MLKVYYNRFMAYYIFHESWLYPKSIIPLIGFIMCLTFQCQIAILGFRNYRLGVGIWCSGEKGGEVNVPQKLGVSSHKLGFSLKSGSFSIFLCDLYSNFWYVSWHEVWFTATLWKVCPLFWFCITCLLIVLVHRFGILLIFHCPLFPGWRAFTEWFMSLPGGWCITLDE